MAPSDAPLPPPPASSSPVVDASDRAAPSGGADAASSPDAGRATTLRMSPSRVVARAGELTPGWRITLTIGWMGVVIALAAVWNASRQLGLPTWWLGPETDPRPVFVVLLPFAGPACAIVATLNRVRHAPWIGLGAAASVAVVGIGDLDPVTRLGVVELAIAAAGAMISLAGFAGRYGPPVDASREGDDTDARAEGAGRAAGADLAGVADDAHR